jgi:hypothetical protein
VSWSNTKRMGYAVLAGLVATALPASLFWLIDWTDDSIVTWSFAPVLGPMVFQLICRRRPDWGWGLAFGAFLAVVFGVWGGIHTPIREVEGGSFGIGLILSALTLLAGALGATVATVVGRAFDVSAKRRGAEARWFRPWHVGIGIVLAELVAVAVIVVAKG